MARTGPRIYLNSVGIFSSVGNTIAAVRENVLAHDAVGLTRTTLYSGSRAMHIGVVERLVKRDGRERVENSCRRGNGVQACSYRHVATILDNGLDRVTDPPTAPVAPLHHANVRGPGYYH